MDQRVKVQRMNRRFRNPLKYCLVMLLALGSVQATVAADSAANGVDISKVPVLGVTLEVRDRVLQAVTSRLPDLPVLAVVKTPLPDMVSLELEGGQTLYATTDGKFLLSGDLYQLNPELVNLAEDRRNLRRREIMQTIPTAEMVVFPSRGETKTHINVFTDVDCGYCRKLHQEVPALNAQGIEVRYLAYPRAGFDTPTYDKIVSAWCADNPRQAITKLKNGQNIPNQTCDNPVERQFEIGRKVGVTGTPAIVTADGALIPGYRPAADLAAALGIK